MSRALFHFVSHLERGSSSVRGTFTFAPVKSNVASELNNYLSHGKLKSTSRSISTDMPNYVESVGADDHHQNRVVNGTTKSHSTLENGFETRTIHDGQDPKQWGSRAVIPPISMATTFQQDAPGVHSGFEYSRSGNPTRSCLEKCIASLEEGKYATCFASGSAVTTSLSYLLNSGDHVVSCDDVYGGTNRFFRKCASKMGIETTFVDAREPANVVAAIQPNTKMIWIETPTNPTLKLIDIKAVAEIKGDALLIVDNTFMSSYFQKPLTLGADIVLHSLTKYMNGHSDVVMGAAVTNSENLNEQLVFYQNALGAIPSPFDCFLVNRGLKTLHVRMDRHHENGLAVAKFLEKHPAVESVIHPGLPSHPQYELSMRQCSGFSGMVSFYLKGGLKESEEFLRRLKIFVLAESLGSVESLVELPSVMTHASVPAEQREELGITDSLIRLSVGLESEKDLLYDLDQALKHAQKLQK